jgi:hypothetical protein
MDLELYCSMCGKEKTIPVHVDAASGKIDAAEAIRKAGWITQSNGENFDIYCSKQCAS